MINENKFTLSSGYFNFSAGLDFLVISTVNDMPDEHFFLSLGCFIS